MSSHQSLLGRSLVFLAVSAGVSHAQQAQRVEIINRRAVSSDSAERVLKGLQRRLDSLQRVFYESDDVSSTERRRIQESITLTVNQLRPLVMRLGEELPAAGSMRIIVSPMMKVQAMAMEEAARPTGWIGFVTEGASAQWIDSGEMYVRYFSYPRILSIDPSSPAQRAGLEPSDTLLAYDGRDVRNNDISLTALLKPNAKVSVRIRRDGKVRDVPLIVAKAPSRIVARREDETRALRADTGTWVPEAPGFARAGAVTRVVAGAAKAPQAPRTVQGVMAGPTPAPPATGGVVSARGFGGFTFSNGVAGAQLEMINEDWAPQLGVSTGVVVVRSPAGSPARESGLLGGDAIVKVSGQAVRSVMEVRDLVSQATDNGEHSVELEIIRAKKPLKLTLRWQ